MPKPKSKIVEQTITTRRVVVPDEPKPRVTAKRRQVFTDIDGTEYLARIPIFDR